MKEIKKIKQLLRYISIAIIILSILALITNFVKISIISQISVILITALSISSLYAINKISCKKTIKKTETKETKKTGVEGKEDKTGETKIRETRIKEATDQILANTEDIADINSFSEKLLSNISKKYEIVQGLFFIKQDETNYKLSGSYSFYKEGVSPEVKLGEGITGQVAKNKKQIKLSNIPYDYITIESGLGSSSPKYLLIFPVVKGDKTIAVVELASFVDFNEETEAVFERISERLVPIMEKYME